MDRVHFHLFFSERVPLYLVKWYRLGYLTLHPRSLNSKWCWQDMAILPPLSMVKPPSLTLVLSLPHQFIRVPSTFFNDFSSTCGRCVASHLPSNLWFSLQITYMYDIIYVCVYVNRDINGCVFYINIHFISVFYVKYIPYFNIHIHTEKNR